MDETLRAQEEIQKEQMKSLIKSILESGVFKFDFSDTNEKIVETIFLWWKKNKDKIDKDESKDDSESFNMLVESINNIFPEEKFENGDQKKHFTKQFAGTIYDKIIENSLV